MTMPDLMQEIEAVLRPFSEALDGLSSWGDSDDCQVYDHCLTIGHFRRARALLTRLSEQGGEPVAYLHEIREPERDTVYLLSKAGANPWSHWMQEHLDRCIYNRTPLYAAPATPAVGMAETDEKFLLAYVSRDSKVVGLEHDTDADWCEVLNAHVALRDRLNERIAGMDKCPFKPALATPPDTAASLSGHGELRERLNGISDLLVWEHCISVEETCRLAALAIASLEGEIERLRAGDKEWGRLHQQVIEERAAALNENERLKRERDERVKVSLSAVSRAISSRIASLEAALGKAREETSELQADKSILLAATARGALNVTGCGERAPGNIRRADPEGDVTSQEGEGL
jgi:hypothetical protein